MSVLRAARGAGYRAVQYNMACSGLPALPDALTAAQAEAVRRAGQMAGVAVVAVSGTCNLIHPDPGLRAAGLRRLGVLIDHAAAMGAGMVTLCTGTRDPQDPWRHHPDNAGPEAWRDLLEAMALLCPLAEARGLRLGIEPELANVVDGAARARRLIDSLQSPAPAIVLDPANLFERTSLARQREIVTHAVETLADRIVMAHAKDRDAAGGFVAAGQGVVDFPHVLNRLRGAGFDGDLVAHGLTADEAPAVAAFLAGL